MNIRRSVLVYQFSERIKSELIIASELLERMCSLKGEARIGAERMMTTFLEALVREIRIAQGIEKSVKFLGAEKKVREAMGILKLSERADPQARLSQALSYVTTSCQGAMECLEDRGIL